MISRQRITVTFALLFVAALFTPAVTVFSGLAVAPIYAVLVVSALFEGMKRRVVFVPFGPAVMAAILFCSWALVSCYWAPDRDASLMQWAGSFTVLIMSFLVYGVFRQLRQTQVELIAWALMIGVPLMLLCCAIELVQHGAILEYFRTHFSGKPGGYNPENYNRGACFLALIFWPLIMAVLRITRGNSERNSAGLVFLLVLWVLTLFVLLMLKSLSAKVGFAAGTGTLIVAMLLPRHSVRLLQFAFLLTVAAIPVLAGRLEPLTHVNDPIPPSGLHRLFIWRFAADKAMEKPWLGWGFHGSRHVPGALDTVQLPNQSVPVGWVQLPNHPHDAILQIWLELGIVGLALYALMGVLAFAWAEQEVRHPLQRAAVLAMIVAYFVASLTAFNVWQEWWIAGGLLGFLLLRVLMDGFILGTRFGRSYRSQL